MQERKKEGASLYVTYDSMKRPVHISIKESGLSGFLAFIIAGFLAIRVCFACPDFRKFFYCDFLEQHTCHLFAMFVQEVRNQTLVHARFHCRIDGLFQIAAVCA